MKTLLIALCLVVSFAACKKDDSQPNITPTPAFSLVGTWMLETAKVTIDGKDYVVSRADITKGGFFKPTDLDITFTGDGKYSRGTETGNYTLAGPSLKLGDRSYNSFTNPDLTSYVYGNIWNGETNQVLKDDVFFVGQKILDNVQGPPLTNSKTASYAFTYKKK
jgi:hypothetical protein